MWRHDGYPDPFLRRDPRFGRGWGLRTSRILKEGARDLARIQVLDQLTTPAELPCQRAGEHVVYRTLARDVSGLRKRYQIPGISRDRVFRAYSS